ncbi:MAG: hypothetical protein GW754_04405 [Candidatus Pacebacteria bacterium]|nr:hypothetical protein [Candidatus Pacearchaeota archaeon]NCQ66053.1 hypothetical protein [Candidatus Paceibacterota bacterium]NCS86632.1 hypothetical protein [Candidatus Paceibacterota bacterium]
MKNDFLKELQKEATTQKKLNEERIFPEFLDEITSFIGIHSWQTLLILSVLSTILVELI